MKNEGRRTEAEGQGGQRDTKVSSLTKAQANDSSTGTQGAPGTSSCPLSLLRLVGEGRGGQRRGIVQRQQS